MTDQEAFELIFSCNKEHTREQLKKLQSLTLDQKIQATKVRIGEWYQHYNGKVYVSFSGGKDSTVLLHIARKCFPDIEAVFVDTGLEYPEIRQFVKQHENVTTLRPKMRFDEVIKKYGYPVVSKAVSESIRKLTTQNISERYRNYLLNGDSRGTYGTIPQKWKCLIDAPFKCSGQCCNIMKKQPAHAYSKKTGKQAMTAQIAVDSRTRELKWLQNGCNAFDTKSPISNPLSFWTEQDVLQYIKLCQKQWDFSLKLCNMKVNNRSDKQKRKKARRFISTEKHRLEIASVYGEIVSATNIPGQERFFDTNETLKTTGCDRTGCMFCMFGVHLEPEPNRFQRMKITHPKQYDYCINELGIGKVLDYIGVKSQ